MHPLKKTHRTGTAFREVVSNSRTIPAGNGRGELDFAAPANLRERLSMSGVGVRETVVRCQTQRLSRIAKGFMPAVPQRARRIAKGGGLGLYSDKRQ